MDQIVNVSTSLINTTIGTAAWTLKPILKIIEKGSGGGGSSPQQVVVRETIHLLPPNMRKWLTVAGFMGASAVAIGAYGAHVVYPRKEIPDNRKAIFETANKYHFLHSLAIISVPFARKSGVTGGLFIIGTLLFSGSCYYYAITDNKKASAYAPYGGVTLILAWLSLAL